MTEIRFTVKLSSATRRAFGVVHSALEAEAIKDLLVEHLRDFLEQANEEANEEAP